MNWTELLNAEIQSSYETTERLLALVDPNSLQWKPATGSNWMTMGQLPMHLTGTATTCSRASSPAIGDCLPAWT
jgi:hypothetical protein